MHLISQKAASFPDKFSIFLSINSQSSFSSFCTFPVSPLSQFLHCHLRLTSKALASSVWFNLIVDVSNMYIERFGLDVFLASGIVNIWIVLLVQETPMVVVHVHKSKGENPARFPQTSPSPLDILLSNSSTGLEGSGEIIDGVWSDIADNGGSRIRILPGLSCRFRWRIQIWLLRFGWESQRTRWSFRLVGQGSGLGFLVFCQENRTGSIWTGFLSGSVYISQN